MARFLLAVWSLESHVNPNLAVATALRERGHEAAFYAGEKAAAEVAQSGFRVFPFRAVREDAASRQFAALLEDQGNARKLSRTFADVLLSQLVPQVDDLAQVLATWQPDVLITDMAMAAPFAILHEWKRIPVAVLSHVGYCMVPGPEGPIPGRAMAPRRSLASRARAMVIHRAADWITRRVPQELDRIRRQYGLAATGLRVTQLHARVNLLLIPSIPELDYNRTDLPPTVRYVGPCLWPPWEAAPAGRTDRPLIVVEEGGYYRQEPFLLRAAMAALGGAEWDVRLLAGRERNVAELGQPAPNIQFCKEVSYPSVTLTTGNTESVLRALRQGTPLIVVPCLLDQTEMALRVKIFGAGIFLSERECTPAGLRAAVKEVLADERYKKRAAEAAALLTRYSGASEVARVLESLLPPNSKQPADC